MKNLEAELSVLNKRLRGNVLFVDGSVRFMKIPDAAHFQQGPGYTFFWDGPR